MNSDLLHDFTFDARRILIEEVNDQREGVYGWATAPSSRQNSSPSWQAEPKKAWQAFERGNYDWAQHAMD